MSGIASLRDRLTQGFPPHGHSRIALPHRHFKLYPFLSDIHDPRQIPVRRDCYPSHSSITIARYLYKHAEWTLNDDDDVKANNYNQRHHRPLFYVHSPQTSCYISKAWMVCEKLSSPSSEREGDATQQGNQQIGSACITATCEL